MTSQGSQSLLPNPLCLPLSKFSHATSSRSSEGQIPWIHLSSQNDLFVIFDVRTTQNAVGAVERRQHFKILQDPTVLEDIDLQILASEAQRAALEVKSAQDSRVNPQIAVLVRQPCIAIKYPINNGTFRRFQVRFTYQEHFYEAMSILTRAGVPVLEAGTIPKQNEQASKRLMTSQIQQTNNIEPAQAQYQQWPVPVNIGQTLSIPSTDATTIHNKTTSQTSLLSNMPVPHQFHTAQLLPSASHVRRSHVSDHSSANEVATRQTENQGPYLNAPSIGISSQPQHIASSVISIYTPRPSTAPESVTIPTMDSMPPRRELPFTRKWKQSNTHNEESNSNTNLGQPTGTSRIDEIPVADFHEVPDSCSNRSAKAADEAVYKPRKRAPTKPRKAPAPKKPRTISRRQEPATRHINEEIPIPSAAELTSHVEQVTPTIDTQKLCARVEAKAASDNEITRDIPPKPGQNYEPNDVNEINVVSKVSKKNHNTRSQLQREEQAVRDPQEIQSLQAPSLKPPCTAADQLIQNLMCTTNSTSITSNDKHKTPHNSGLERTLTTKNLLPPQLQSSTTTTIQPHFIEPNDSTAILSSPSFTQAASKLDEFVNLPPHKQHDLLEKFICQSLDDENFKTLCKTVEGVWSRALCLKP